jgi:Holliday junction resolvase RusA-like endonuclease
MIITIPFRTPTINKLYWNWKGRLIKTKIAKELEQTICELIPECLEKKRLLRVEIAIYENWWYKNGEVARKDMDNRTKFLIDAVFKALKIDDRYIFDLKIKKVQSTTEEKSIIEIIELL